MDARFLELLRWPALLYLPTITPSLNKSLLKLVGAETTVTPSVLHTEHQGHDSERPQSFPSAVPKKLKNPVMVSLNSCTNPIDGFDDTVSSGS